MILSAKNKRQCKFDAVEGDDLCGHHRRDALRGCSTSKAAHLQHGKEHVIDQPFLPLSSPLALLSLPTTHALRVENWVQTAGFDVVFVERLRTGHEIKMLVGGRDSSGALTVCAKILAYAPLRRILSRPPMVVCSSSSSFPEVVTSFSSSCSASIIAGKTVKIVGSAKLKRRLLQSAIPGCSPTGDYTFVIDALYEDAVFLFGIHETTSLNSPACKAPRKNEICKAVYKVNACERVYLRFYV